jgi:hypothetical protein
MVITGGRRRGKGCIDLGEIDVQKKEGDENREQQCDADSVFDDGLAVHLSFFLDVPCLFWIVLLAVSRSPRGRRRTL